MRSMIRLALGQWFAAWRNMCGTWITSFRTTALGGRCSQGHGIGSDLYANRRGAPHQSVCRHGLAACSGLAVSSAEAADSGQYKLNEKFYSN
jgi:hypothetical protein